MNNQAEDKDMCSFYMKNGSCRYGSQCTKKHTWPTISKTLLFAHFYQNSPLEISLAEGQKIPNEKLEEVVSNLEQWYAEVFLEICKFGEILELHILDNIGDHLLGNVFVKFVAEEDAENVMKNISRRRFRGQLVMPEYSPVQNFEVGSCGQFYSGTCRRGGNCNFLHIKSINKNLLRALYIKMYKD